MILVADTHVHIYPHYSLEKLLWCAWLNLGNLCKEVAGETERALFLTERADCGFYEKLLKERYPFEVVPVEAGSCAKITFLQPEGEGHLFIFPGFQVVTRQRIEVLALVTRTRVPEGLDLFDTIRLILDSDGIPVLPWAFGKWLGRRGALVERVIEQGHPPLSLGDTSLGSLAPFGPALLAKGKDRGYPILAGTDPLPIRGEEELVGSYGIVTPSTIDRDRPGTSFRNALCAAPGEFRIVGSHSSLLRVAMRLYGNERARRRR